MCLTIYSSLCVLLYIQTLSPLTTIASNIRDTIARVPANLYACDEYHQPADSNRIDKRICVVDLSKLLSISLQLSHDVCLMLVLVFSSVCVRYSRANIT